MSGSTQTPVPSFTLADVSQRLFRIQASAPAAATPPPAAAPPPVLAGLDGRAQSDPGRATVLGLLGSLMDAARGVTAVPPDANRDALVQRLALVRTDAGTPAANADRAKAIAGHLDTLQADLTAFVARHGG